MACPFDLSRNGCRVDLRAFGPAPGVLVRCPGLPPPLPVSKQSPERLLLVVSCPPAGPAALVLWHGSVGDGVPLPLGKGCLRSSPEGPSACENRSGCCNAAAFSASGYSVSRGFAVRRGRNGSAALRLRLVLTTAGAICCRCFCPIRSGFDHSARPAVRSYRAMIRCRSGGSLVWHGFCAPLCADCWPL